MINENQETLKNNWLKEVNLFKDKERVSLLEKQIPYWEMVFGLSLLCSLLIYYREELLKLGQNFKTWNELAKVKNE